MGDNNLTPQPKPFAMEWLHKIRQNREVARAREVPSKADLQQVERRLQRRIEKINPNKTNKGEIVTRAARMMARGFTDISKSMSSPDAPKNRMAIAQLPSPQKSPMRQGFDLSRLKDPTLRSRNIQGKRIK